MSSKNEWPNTTAPDKTNPYWERNNNMNCNGTQYKKAEVEPGKWQWIVDEAAMNYLAEIEKHRRDLYWALRSRVLTDAEMLEVEGYGDRLNIQPMVSYNAEEKKREMNDALLQQFKLRLAAERAASIAKL
jgi:hypothetical protein